MSDISDTECNFIFDSNEGDEYSEEKDEETLQIFQLLNQKKNLSPFSNMQSEKENDLNEEDNEYSSIEDIPMNINEEDEQKSDSNNSPQDQNSIEEEEEFLQEEDNQKSTNQIRLEISKNEIEYSANFDNNDSYQDKSESKDENIDVSNSQESPRRKKKKNHTNKIPSHLLVTRNELNKENESKIIKEKPKRISKKEMKKMINRLTQPPKQKTTPQKEIESPKSKTQANPQTFDRLYQMSQDKVKKNEQLRKEFEEEEMNYPVRKAAKSNKKSNELAEQQLCSFIESEFPKKEFLTESELDNVLHKLGILDNKEMMYKNPAVKSIMDSWVTENDGKTVYNASQVKESLISSATQRNFTKFDVYARQRMTIELSDIKQKQRNEKPEPPKEEKKMSKETIMRLSQAREPNPPKKKISSPSNLKPKPKPKPKKPFISEELPPEGISQKTQEILESCDLAHVPFVEREKINAQKKSEKIKKLDQEIHNKKLDVGPQFGQKPQWPTEIKKKLDEYRQKKMNQQSDEPSFKPSVMSFKQYQKKVRKQMMSEQALPEGYEESVSRYRQAYQQEVQKKMEKAKRDPFYELTNVPL